MTNSANGIAAASKGFEVGSSSDGLVEELKPANDGGLEDPGAFADRAEAIRRDYVKGAGQETAHGDLLRLFRDVSDEISLPATNARSILRRASLLTVQSQILDIAAALPARSVEECTYKLALWRSDYVRSEDEIWPRGDIVASTALEDLIALTGLVEARFEDDLRDDD